MRADIEALKAAARVGKDEAAAKEAARVRAQKDKVDREKDFAVLEQFAESDRAAMIRQRNMKRLGAWALHEASVFLRSRPLSTLISARRHKK